MICALRADKHLAFHSKEQWNNGECNENTYKEHFQRQNGIVSVYGCEEKKKQNFFDGVAYAHRTHIVKNKNRK